VARVGQSLLIFPCDADESKLVSSKIQKELKGRETWIPEIKLYYVAKGLGVGDMGNIKKENEQVIMGVLTSNSLGLGMHTEAVV